MSVICMLLLPRNRHGKVQSAQQNGAPAQIPPAITAFHSVLLFREPVPAPRELTHVDTRARIPRTAYRLDILEPSSSSIVRSYEGVVGEAERGTRFGGCRGGFGLAAPRRVMRSKRGVAYETDRTGKNTPIPDHTHPSTNKPPRRALTPNGWVWHLRGPSHRGSTP